MAELREEPDRYGKIIDRLRDMDVNVMTPVAALNTLQDLIDEVRDYETYHRLFRAGTDGKASGPESYERVPMLHNGWPQPLLPVVPCSFTKKDVEAYYAEHCYMLTNIKSEDNYLDLR